MEEGKATGREDMERRYSVTRIMRALSPRRRYYQEQCLFDMVVVAR
jgi:hypothetical protein